MTVDQVLALYMPKRKELFQRGVPIRDWKVQLHPEDAADLQLEVKEPVTGQQVYGATWEIDATVKRGTIRILAGGQIYNVSGS